MAAAIAAVALFASAGAATGSPLGASVDYLAAQQDARTGGFSSGAAGRAPAPAFSAWAALAVASNREDPRRWKPRRRSLADAATELRADASLGDVLRAAVAARASGLHPHKVLAIDPRAAVDRALADGTLESGSVTQAAWAIFALRVSGVSGRDPRVAGTAVALRAAQLPDGGWSFVGQARSDVITTATVVQALVASGAPRTGDPALDSARRYLSRALRRDGGFGVRKGRRSRAIPSAWAALAIRALGERSGSGLWRRGGGPTAYLRRMSVRGGALRKAALASGDPTQLAQALTTLALAGRPLPFVRRGRMRTVRHAPAVVAREPAPGGSVEGLLIARYRDDANGVGVAPRSVRMIVNGRDMTRYATATPFAVQLPGLFIPPGRVRIQIRLSDRAGNSRSSRWVVRGPSGGR